MNHLKSKGTGCDRVGDPDAGDGQGDCNVTRTRPRRPWSTGWRPIRRAALDPDVMIIGDMNTYRLEDPIRPSGLVVTWTCDRPVVFYVFDGESGYLNHALASPTLHRQVTGITEWHINADEPMVLDYNVEFKSARQVANTSIHPTPTGRQTTTR